MFKTSPAAQNPDGFSTNPTAANCSQPLKQPKVQLDSKQNPTRCKLFTPPPLQQPEVEMNSTQNPSAANYSQPPQQSNGSSRICYQTPNPQTVHNLPSCPRYSRILHQNLLLQAVRNPHISQSPAGLSTTPCPGKQYTTDSNKTLSCKLLSTFTEA